MAKVEQGNSSQKMNSKEGAADQTHMITRGQAAQTGEIFLSVSELSHLNQ